MQLLMPPRLAAFQPLLSLLVAGLGQLLPCSRVQPRLLLAPAEGLLLLLPLLLSGLPVSWQ
jgi:hypothetical protein